MSRFPGPNALPLALVMGLPHQKQIWSEKFRHGGEIPTVGIGKRPGKIPLWWEISLSGRKKVFRCMDHLVLRHPSYMRGFTYPFSLSGGRINHRSINSYSCPLATYLLDPIFLSWFPSCLFSLLLFPLSVYSSRFMVGRREDMPELNPRLLQSLQWYNHRRSDHSAWSHPPLK